MAITGAGFGWLIGRITKKTDFSQPSEQCVSFYREMSQLDGEASDKAVAILERLIEQDSSTIDASLSLAALFRRKGEIDKAIALHQKVLAHQSLSGELKNQVLYQLGQDYLAAGLLCRAENIFEELKKHNEIGSQSTEQLLTIYKKTAEWEKAIALLRGKGQKKADLERLNSLAHCYCEMADQSLAKGEIHAAIKLYTQANKAVSKHTRAELGLAKCLLLTRQYGESEQYVEHIVETNRERIDEALRILEDIYRAQDNGDGFLQKLEELLNQSSSVELVEFYCDALIARNKHSALSAFLVPRLDASADIRLYLKWFESLPDKDAVLGHLHYKLISMNEESRVYLCSNCGLKTHMLSWKCPGCEQWETLNQVSGI
jgi:lipopolysaccharide biosynthesis regulator YciM